MLQVLGMGIEGTGGIGSSGGAMKEKQTTEWNESWREAVRKSQGHACRCPRVRDIHESHVPYP